MSPRHLTRLFVTAAVLGVIATASAGCAGVSGATPVPTTTASPEPESTVTPDPEPTPVPTPVAPSTEEPPATDGEFGAFTRDGLTQICVDATISTFNSDVRFDTGSVRIEHRIVSPEWLVIVPAKTGGFDGQSVCTIGGTPSAPVLELASGSITEMPEEQIQRLIRGENEGGDR